VLTGRRSLLLLRRVSVTLGARVCFLRARSNSIVVDARITLFIPATHLQADTYTIAEKATGFISARDD
jgi:hypothetical protein